MNFVLDPLHPFTTGSVDSKYIVLLPLRLRKLYNRSGYFIVSYYQAMASKKMQYGMFSLPMLTRSPHDRAS